MGGGFFFFFFFFFVTRFTTALLQNYQLKPLNPNQPYYNLLLQAGSPRLAATFVPKCAPTVDQGQTITMYEKCGMRVKAAGEAVRLKDTESWIRLLDAAGRQSADGKEIERLGQGIFRK